MLQAVDHLVVKRQLDQLLKSVIGPLRIAQITTGHDNVVCTKGLIADDLDPELLRLPADKAKPPAARDAKAPEIHPWTAGELSAFLSWVDDHGCSDAVAYRLLAYTGVRRGELLALRWRDLDTDAGRLSVRHSVGVVKSKGKGEQVIEGPTKTGRQRSWISTLRRSLRCVAGGWHGQASTFGWSGTSR